MNVKKYVWGISTFLVLYLASSCGVEEPPVVRTNLRIQVGNEIDILNPALSRLSVSTFVESQMTLPLAHWDEEDRRWIPVLVQSYNPRFTEQGVEYALRMRPQARWSDGTPITIQDLEFTIKMGLNPYISHQSWAAYLALISDISVSHDTIILAMETPYILADEFIAGITPYPAHTLDTSSVLESISFESFQNGVFSTEEDQKLRELAEVFNSWGSPRQWPQPVSGLFKVSDWIPGQHVRLSKVDQFWGGEVEELSAYYNTNFDSLQFVVIPDPQNALHAFTSGVVDIVNTMENGDTALISDFSGRVHEVPTLQMFYVSVNNTHPLLGITEVRRALNLAIHRQDIVDRLFDGRGQPAYGPIHPAKSYYTALPAPFDPDEARHILRILECMDVDDDGILECPVRGKYMKLAFEIWTTRSHLSRNVATLLKGYWKSIGVDLKIRSADFRTFLPELQNKSYDLATLALRQNNLLDDPYPLWHSSQGDASGKNYQGLGVDSIDVVLENLREAVTPEDQLRHYGEFQRLFAEHVPVFFLVAPDEAVAVREGIDLHWSSQRPGYDLLRSRFRQ